VNENVLIVDTCILNHNVLLVISDVKFDSPRRIDSLGSFFKKETIQKIRSLRIDSLQINKCVQFFASVLRVNNIMTLKQISERIIRSLHVSMTH